SQSAAYEAVAVTDGGTLSGTVKFDGTPPAPGKIQVTKDPEVCGQEKVAPELLVAASGGIANAVVSVKASKGKKLEVPAQNPVFDQKTCEFHPHILLFPAGSTVDVLNSDGILHNIHTTSQTNPSANQAQPKYKAKIQIKVEKPEWPIRVQCDVHPWMGGYWISAETPYVALTAAQCSSQALLIRGRPDEPCSAPLRRRHLLAEHLPLKDGPDVRGKALRGGLRLLELL